MTRNEIRRNANNNCTWNYTTYKVILWVDEYTSQDPSGIEWEDIEDARAELEEYAQAHEDERKRLFIMRHHSSASLL